MSSSEQADQQARKAAIQQAAARRIEAIVAEAQGPNHYGAYTLFKREFLRFWKISTQTVLSPVVTTLLYFLVFGYALGGRVREVQGLPYMDFIVPGLVLLGVVNGAFANSAFSLLISKIHGVINDVLIAPLSYWQLIFGYVAASVVRALMIGGAIWAVAIAMGAGVMHSPLHILPVVVLSALAFALLGVIVAITSEDFERINIVPSFIIMPLVFLGGVFYSVKMLPDPWGVISRFNPIFYMVNALRHGMTGYGDAPYWQGLVCLLGLCSILFAVALGLLRTGYKLRD